MIKIVRAIVILFSLITVLNPVIASETSRWSPIGPLAGTIHRIVPHRGIPNLVFAINNNHLYRSTDAAKHWQRIALEHVLDLQIHLKSGLIFALTINPARNYHGYTESLFWVSQNGGKDFSFLSGLELSMTHVRIHPEDPNVLFTWGNDLYKSKDGGLHWDVISNFPNEDYAYYSIRDVLVSPFDPQTIFASAEQYVSHATYDDVILESANLGNTWKVGQRKHQLRQYGPYSFHVDASFPGRILAYSSGRGVQTLTSMGWIEVSDFGITDLSSDPTRRSHLFGLHYEDYCDLRLYETFDEGVHWKRVSEDLDHHITTVAMLNIPSFTLLGGTAGAGVFRREGNRDWIHSGSGILEGDITNIGAAIDSQTPMVLSAGVFPPYCRESFLYQKKKNGWLDRLFQLPVEDIDHLNDVAVHPSNPDHAFLTGYHNGFNRILVSFDGGEKWTISQFDAGYPILTFDKRQPNVVYAGIYKSVDGGLTFQPLPADFGRFPLSGDIRIFVDENNSNVLYFLGRRKDILKSTDGGLSVFSVAGDPPTDGLSMAQLPGEDSYLLLTRTARIYRTLNGGGSWHEFSRIDHRRLEYTASMLWAADSKGDHFYATLNNRYLYESIDGGKNWTNITEQFGKDVSVYEITDPRSSFLFVATSQGVFQENRTP